MAPATVTAYAEYPKGGKKYWAVPVEGDATGWAYRKDWFEDPKEMAAFKAKYGYDLAPAEDLGRNARHRRVLPPSRQEAYGIAIYTGNPYDALVMGYENALFSFGGELGDYSTYKVDGIVNSPRGRRGA